MPSAAPASVPARTKAENGNTGKREPVASSSQGAIASGSRAATPEAHTKGVAATTTSASTPAQRVQLRPASHCSSSTKSCVAAITCSASQANSSARSALVEAPSVFHSEKYGRCR